VGHYVHISVVMSCNNEEKLIAIAKNHINDPDLSFEASGYLRYIIQGKSVATGPKGSLSTWGMVGNYTSHENFVDGLVPFWSDLYKNDDVLFKFERIIVFCEPEQSQRAECYEIRYDAQQKGVLRAFHSLPFAWMQF